MEDRQHSPRPNKVREIKHERRVPYLSILTKDYWMLMLVQEQETLLPNLWYLWLMSPKRYFPLIPFSSRDQFRQNIFRLIHTTMTDTGRNQTPNAILSPPGLKKIPPYWYPYTTMAKMRWLGRELLEVVSTEFRDRSMEYYVRPLQMTMIGCWQYTYIQRYALESGMTTVNGKIAKPDTVLKDGDRIE